MDLHSSRIEAARDTESPRIALTELLLEHVIQADRDNGVRDTGVRGGDGGDFHSEYLPVRRAPAEGLHRYAGATPVTVENCMVDSRGMLEVNGKAIEFSNARFGLSRCALASEAIVADPPEADTVLLNAEALAGKTAVVGICGPACRLYRSVLSLICHAGHPRRRSFRRESPACTASWRMRCHFCQYTR
eukprot:SAG31_NODE_930_length_10920_cov_4.478329_6_plen_189_part_00